MEDLAAKFKKTLYFLGRKALFWLILGAFSGASLGIVELGLSVLLSSLLLALGMLQPEEMPSVAGYQIPLISAQSLFIALLMIMGLRGVFDFFVRHSATLAQEVLNARLRCVALYELLQSNKGFISSSETNTKVSEIFPKAAQFANHGASAIPSAIQCITLLTFMLFAAWQETLIASTGILVIGFLVMYANRTVRRIASRVPREQKHLLRGIERVARNWLLVKVLRTEQREYEKLTQNTLNYSSHSIRARFIANLASVLPLGLGGVLIVMIIGSNLLFLETKGPILLAFLYLLVRFTQQLGTFAKSMGNMSSFYPQFKMAAAFFFQFSSDEIRKAVHPLESLNMMGRHQKKKKKAKPETEEPSFSKPPAIEMKAVSFRYHDTGPWILHDFDLQVPSGSQFGVVGKSGSGKSTLLGLLLGVLEPQKGEILYDGIPCLKYLTKEESRIGYVGAEPFLLEGSLKENLDYGAKRTYRDEEYRHALKQAQLLEFIENSSQGLNYKLKENGEGLSAGQKQRLALARAFLAKPHLLVLDEASANLDDATEGEIAEAIVALKGKTTTLIVSHRPGILKYADSNLQLDEANL